MGRADNAVRPDGVSRCDGTRGVFTMIEYDLRSAQDFLEVDADDVGPFLKCGACQGLFGSR